MRAWRFIQFAWRGTRCSWESDEASPDPGVPTRCVPRLDSFRDDPRDQPRSDVRHSEFPRTLKETMGPGYIGGATIDRPFGTQLPKCLPSSELYNRCGRPFAHDNSFLSRTHVPRAHTAVVGSHSHPYREHRVHRNLPPGTHESRVISCADPSAQGVHDPTSHDPNSFPPMA